MTDHKELIEKLRDFYPATQDMESTVLCDLLMASADALEAATVELSKTIERVQHLKRGTTYEVMAYGKVQTDRPLSDYSEVVIYRGEADGLVWVRPIDEFNDPERFDDLTQEAATAEQVAVVKPLEWSIGEFKHLFSGRYEINTDTFQVFIYDYDMSEDNMSYLDNLAAEMTCETLEEAKAAAQADYERRILSAITARPASEVRNEALGAAEKIAATSKIVSDDDYSIGWTDGRRSAANAIRALKGGVE